MAKRKKHKKRRPLPVGKVEKSAPDKKTKLCARCLPNEDDLNEFNTRAAQAYDKVRKSQGQCTISELDGLHPNSMNLTVCSQNH